MHRLAKAFGVPMTHATTILSAIAAGATTSHDAARVTGIGHATAKVVISTLTARGTLRWTGRCVNRAEGQRGRTGRIYEVVEKGISP